MSFHVLSAVLRNTRLPFDTEAVTQAAIEKLLTERGITFAREHKFGPAERVDFFCCGSIALEIKIQGSAKAIYRQLVRYAQHDACKAVVLATARAMRLPQEINGKPCVVVNLTRAWL